MIEQSGREVLLILGTALAEHNSRRICRNGCAYAIAAAGLFPGGRALGFFGHLQPQGGPHRTLAVQNLRETTKLCYATQPCHQVLESLGLFAIQLSSRVDLQVGPNSFHALLGDANQAATWTIQVGSQCHDNGNHERRHKHCEGGTSTQ